MNEKNNQPLYEKIRQKLLVSFAELEYFAPLPGERELCQQFAVSRPTIRKALDCLEQDSVITRIQGRGSFYIGKKIALDYSETDTHGLGLFEVLSSAGKFIRSQVLQQVAEAPTPKISACLKLEKDDLIFHLKRLRYVNDELYSLADDYIPLKFCPQLLEKDFSQASLIGILKENNIMACREDKTIEIKRAEAQEAAYLGLAKGDPIALTRIITYDSQNRILQYAISRTDAYKTQFRFVSALK